MGLDATLENGVQLHWATPIFTRKFDDTEELNARLARIILEREQQDPGVPKSVVHGMALEGRLLPSGPTRRSRRSATSSAAP